MTQRFTLRRTAETRRSTCGALCDPEGEPLCKILERGARNPDHVRIPAGVYRVARKPLGASHFDDAFKRLLGEAYRGVLWLPDVRGRANIEIHSANFVNELLGCLATATDIGKDTHGDFMGLASRAAYLAVYPAISNAIDSGGAELAILDIPE